MRFAIYPGILLVILIFSASCRQGKEEDKYKHFTGRNRIRLQYLKEGRRFYLLLCVICHQPDGGGLARLYPPLKNSDYLLAERASVICGMKFGQKGEIVVNGIMYNQEMPGIPSLTDLEIAEIATYIYTVFADTAQIITIHEVRSYLDTCQIAGKWLSQ